MSLRYFIYRPREGDSRWINSLFPETSEPRPARTHFTGLIFPAFGPVCLSHKQGGLREELSGRTRNKLLDTGVSTEFRQYGKRGCQIPVSSISSQSQVSLETIFDLNIFDLNIFDLNIFDLKSFSILSSSRIRKRSPVSKSFSISRCSILFSAVISATLIYHVIG
jgi:hypothetical protein